MADDTQNQVKNPTQSGVPVQQPVAAPQVPVAGGKKEMPMATSQEWVAPSTPEVVLPKEVQDAGVEATPVVPTIPPSAQQLGVTHAKESVQPRFVDDDLGMDTPRSVLDQLKTVHKSWKDAMSWLVRMIIKEQDKEKNHPTQSRYE